ncbi:MAG: divergent polysaccharide deacetylase family protein, partial [Thermoanaerobaculaceae bacterium]|nr:divergent polysaccharide deacetylase family protein [Thermoanaerobaculaceae bacterium]
MLLLVLGVAAVVVVSRLDRKAPKPAAGLVQPIQVVREVAARHGCPADAVAAEEIEEPGTALVVVTVHAPRGFPVDRFSLDLQARVHNLGGRLEPLSLGERGGYGLARLEGMVGATRWRVLVLGEPPAARQPARTRTRQAVPRSTPVSGAVLAIVLDDAGNSLDACRQLALLPAEVAVAVLPNTPHATAVAECLRAQGRELLLHLPMQPVPGEGPGPGSGPIEVELSETEVARRLDRALSLVPGVRGVNNHMGSLATADAPTMTALARALRPTGLYFLDSRTTPDSVAESVMHEHGVPALRRDLFLDVVDEPGAISRALHEAVDLARTEGSAVAIGHVHEQTLAVL